MSKIALILGATGLVGGHCLELLLAHPSDQKVVVLGRRPLDLQHPKLEQHVLNFDQLPEASTYFQVNDVFCCLGTTTKKSGDEEKYRKFDYTYPYEAAKLAALQGVQQFSVVTAMATNLRSPIFHLRIKAELEEAITKLPIPTVFFIKPSLITGVRKETRVGEEVASWVFKVLNPILVGPLRKARSIEAKVIAYAMVVLAQQSYQGVHSIESDQLQHFYQNSSHLKIT